MKTRGYKLLLLLIILMSYFDSLGQQQVIHNATFSTENQNMWGPSFSPFTIDKTITLFDESWDVNWDTGSGGIFTIGGYDFGGSFSGSFSGRIGSEIRIEGFTTGTVDVDYPVDITLDMPTDETYDQGDEVSIQTDFVVASGWALETLYPSAGEFFWDLYFEMAAEASAQLCFFGCTTFPLIPAFSTGLQTINLVTISTSGASTDGYNGIWFLGPASASDVSLALGQGPTAPPDTFWPYSLPLSGNPGGLIVLDWIPWQVYVPGLPMDLPDTDFGLTGQITIPYVITDDVLDPSDGTLNACGDSTYFNLNLEIFKVLGFVLSEALPPPYDAIGEFFSNLSGEESVGNAEVWWNFFTASFDANITNKQCFDFTPKIYGKFEFPVPVEYSITDTSGVTSAVQQSSIINLEIGEDLNYKYPCYFEELNITPTYSIDGLFRNHTYDEVTFDFLMEAFEFGFTVPQIIVFPGFTIPEICIPIPYPCPTWSNPFAWCTYTACTPEVVVPPLIFPEWTESVGPLWETTIPLASFTYDWFDQTWSLEGFKDTTFASFKMIANRLTADALAFDADCYRENTGYIAVSVDAVSDAAPYTYNWTNGSTATTGNADTLTGLQGGEYQVNITDANGCQLFTGATVNEPLPLSIDYAKTNKSCAGGASDGSISITVAGGTSPYTYAWSNGETTPNLTGLDVDTYTLTLTDANSCEATLSVTIEEPSLLAHSAIVTDVNCNGGSDGAIDVTSLGGVLPYSFSWSNTDTTENLNAISAGSYTITITDNNGCTSVGTYEVNEPVQPLSITYNSMDVSCYGGSDGMIDLEVQGGTPNYNYQWFSDISGLMTFSGEDPTSIPAATYTVSIADANECVTSEVITISEPSAPIGDSELITTVDCFGDLTGGIDPQINGGTTPYDYAWSNGSTNPVLNNVAAGSYSLLVTDANNCSKSFEYVITQPEAPLAIDFVKEDVKCYGESSGSIQVIASGGTEEYTYGWSNGETTPSIDNLSVGSYSLLLTDELGCTLATNIDIDEPSAPLTSSSTVSNLLCNGESDGNIDLTVSGGTTPYSYTWSDGNSFILSDTTQDLSNLIADEYFVFITDANQCTDTLTSVITEPDAPITSSATITAIECFGMNTGAIDVVASGGNPNYTYSWSNGETTEDLTNVSAGTYILDITDQNNCLRTDTFTVSQPQSALMVTTFGTDVNCLDDATGSIQSVVTGGTMPYTFNWSNGATTSNIDGLTAGSYTLTVTDDNGCTAFSGSLINEPQELVVNINITDPSCYGFEDGEIEIEVTGGVQPYYFDWGDQNSILLNNNGETINNIGTGDYFIRVTDENKCTYEEQVYVDEPEVFEYDKVINDVTCFEGSDGSIELTLSGGTTPYNVDWNNGMSGENIQGLEAGNYGFVATDDQGCTLRDELLVNEPKQIQVSYELEPVSCIDQNDAAIYITPFGGTTPYAYLWSNNVNTQNNEGLAPGFYELTITDDSNCSNTFGFDILMSGEECLGIPNTFTPNGDLYNDTWVIENIELYPNATVKIFNKWGNEIFSSEGAYEPWDGTHMGNDLPAGVYYYIIVLSNDQDNKYTGSLTIVR